MVEITGDQINTVLKTVDAMTGDGDAQLTILTRALVVACKSCEVDKATALEIIGGVFDEPTTLIPLATTN